ncbi:MAG: SDR family NAD(P)-dependent oxidoreductase, partial [Alphaproteobacteria bacterium]|nr:SDR family NAD(P)-dependent oxidoreductase [Alphaproteobacteria bacterium]
MAKRLEGKVALVTGAGSIGPGWGNGKAVAVLFAREGAKVVALDINADAATETAAIIASEGGNCTTITGDVSNSEQVAATVQTCIDTYGRIDLLHNNVGIVVNGGP